jgi:hypothetical protein
MSDLNDARELDSLRGQKLLGRLLERQARRVQEVDGEMTRRGMGSSGIRGLAVLETCAITLEEFVNGRIA